MAEMSNLETGAASVHERHTAFSRSSLCRDFQSKLRESWICKRRRRVEHVVTLDKIPLRAHRKVSDFLLHAVSSADNKRSPHILHVSTFPASLLRPFEASATGTSTAWGNGSEPQWRNVDAAVLPMEGSRRRSLLK
jgi:hypothetical protein